ncbi:hypothetical protein BKA67DRAFT_663875 [Truncatella angustata]|uniref:Uncharacterized protein n=1 Tax=Truncatella angustata TaxID=152316 RepID=A0A9P8RMB0_9PEZI|nr:uncharacterized protein BKA67DRAFT_663875 [Truncatella angustata]KAH6646005.1 hypothetical protein BKA67DRAFT_663875 [Truncatella angustata]KAH8205469.1 hypothetical protein TruAng_000375 [Truncatella angustata]
MSSYSFTSSSSSYSSSYNGRQSGQSFQETSQTTPEGTTVRTTTQNLGETPITQTHKYDSQGRELIGDSANGGSSRRVEDVSRKDVNPLYEERIEDEYAKREGGA